VVAAGSITRLTVTGDGDRIAPDDRARVFEPYARPARQAPVGHGLGLALAKAIVELHGGSLTIEDAPAAGSTFVLELKNSNPPPRLRTVE
jgi:signal transduction histidine kinase